jgi:hypothetical protein
LHSRVTSATTPLPSVYALLAGAIDYAGLFPPAGLDLPTALANYRAYQAGSDAWALGRFVTPVASLPELLSLLPTARDSGPPVALTALLGASLADDVDSIERFNRAGQEQGAEVVAVEVKATTEAMAHTVLGGIPASWRRYLEVPLEGTNDAVLDAIVRGGAFAKIRTGGVAPDAFPAPDQLLRFLERAIARRIAFKATAGLHHPLRGVYRLSYADDAPGAVMFGYLNLLLATAILSHGGDVALAKRALLEEDPGTLRFEVDALVWRELRFTLAVLTGMRRDLCHGFGSCSFREPLDELPGGVGG